ncbi:MAG: alpha-amylase family glycosyl hydrolase [Bacteroidota bacterium]
MNKRFLITTTVVVFVYCSIHYFGCTKIKYNDLNARISTEWVKNAVIYEINLRSFSKDGTFKTLEAQIPELRKRGITIVSLVPIHPIGELNRRGQIGSLDAIKDFYAVNPEFGILKDFQSLVNITHQQGLKIIINLVANQAAWDSQLLMEHPDWFVHNEEGAIVSPNSESSDVAQFDYNQHELRKYMIAVMKFWVQEIGIDGFQCRSAELIPTDFWDVARNELDKIKPVLMISESMLPEHHIKAFDLTCSWNMNNTLANIVSGTVPASIINDSMNAEFLKFPKGSLHLRFKIMRDENIEDIRGINNSSSQNAKTIAILAFTLPGVPLIYTGDEAGNTKQLDLSNKLYEDLNTLRRNHPALRYGSYWNAQNSASYHLFSFIRSSGDDSVLIVVNFVNEKIEANIQMPAGASQLWKNQFSGINLKVKDERLSVAISPLGFLALVPYSEKEIL